MALLPPEEVDARLARLDGWARAGDAIEKAFDRDDFAGAVAFINTLTPVAEEMSHHPDLAVSWKTVTVTIATHSEGGITATDFDLAARIDSLA